MLQIFLLPKSKWVLFVRDRIRAPSPVFIVLVLPSELHTSVLAKFSCLYEKSGAAPAKIARIALVRLVQVLLGLSQVLEQGFQALPGLLIINLDQPHRLPTTCQPSASLSVCQGMKTWLLVRLDDAILVY